MCFYSIKKKDYICHNDYWYQNIPNANIINFLIPHVFCLVSVCSCCLHPLHTAATPSVRVCFTSGHITRECCCSPYSLQAHLQAVLGQCCSPTLTQRRHQRLAAWAAPPEHVDCNAPQCHLTWEWRWFCCAKRRHYIRDVLNRLATRVYSDDNAAWKQCLKIKGFFFYTYLLSQNMFKAFWRIYKFWPFHAKF